MDQQNVIMVDKYGSPVVKENWFTDSSDYEHLAATLNGIVHDGRQIYSIYCLSLATWVVISYKYE